MKKRKKGKDENCEQKNEDEKQRDSTLCIPASQNKCKQEGLMNKIRSLVPDVNKIVLFGNRLMLFHVTRCLEFGMQLPSLDEHFFMACFGLVSSTDERTLQKVENYEGLEDSFNYLFDRKLVVFVKKKKRDVKLRLIDHGSLGSTLSYESQQMEILVKNYNLKAIYDHMKHYIFAKYQLELKGHAKFLCGRITSENPLGYDKIPDNLEASLGKRRIDEIILVEHEIFNTKFRLNTDENAKLVQYRYYMMQQIAERSNDQQAYKSFTVLPQYSIKPHFITLCKKTLNDIAPSNECSSIEDWIHIPQRKGWTIGKTISTNGYEFHISYEKNVERNGKRRKKVSKSNKVSEKSFDPKKEFDVDMINVHNPTLFAAGDPGNHCVITAVSPTGETHKNGSPMFEKRKFTKKRYNFESKRNKVNKKMKFIQSDKILKEYRDWLSMNTMKSPHSEDIRQAVFIEIEAYGVMYKRYSNRQFLKLKMEARMAENKTMDKMIHWITWGGKKPLGWGNVTRTSGFKGSTSSGPVRKIRRRAVKKGYRVYLVDEAYTSKRSCCCSCDTCNLYETIGDETGYEKRKIHGMLICKKCGSTWDRDFSAGINIFDIFYNHMVLGNPRNIKFTKQFIEGLFTGTFFETYRVNGSASVPID